MKCSSWLFFLPLLCRVYGVYGTKDGRGALELREDFSVSPPDSRHFCHNGPPDWVSGASFCYRQHSNTVVWSLHLLFCLCRILVPSWRITTSSISSPSSFGTGRIACEWSKLWTRNAAPFSVRLFSRQLPQTHWYRFNFCWNNLSISIRVGNFSLKSRDFFPEKWFFSLQFINSFPNDEPFFRFNLSIPFQTMTIFSSIKEFLFNGMLFLLFLFRVVNPSMSTSMD